MIPKRFDFCDNAGTAVNLYILSDPHLGSEAFLQDEWDRVGEIIKKDKHAYTIFLGDITDDDRPSTRAMREGMFSDRKEAFRQEDKQHLDYMDRSILPKLKPFLRPDRCLGMLDGDHFRRYSNGLSSVQYICAKMKIPYLGNGMAVITLAFNDRKKACKQFLIHAQHGIGGTGRSGNAVNKLEDIAHGWDGIDCFVRGHNHKGFIYPVSRYHIFHNQEIKTRDMWLINTPSFRTGIIMGTTDYAEAKCYGATPRKFPVLRLKIGKPRSNNCNTFIESSGELV